MSAPNSARSGPTTRTGLRASVAPPKTDGDAESMSIHSLRTSVLNRNTGAHGGTQARREPVASSSRSIRSVSSRHSAYASPGPPTRPVPPNANPTRLRPVTASARSSYASGVEEPVPTMGGTPAAPNAVSHPRNSTSSTAPRRSMAPTTSPNPPAGRPRSLAPSIISIRSTTSTVRHSHRSKDSPNDEQPPATSGENRPVSAVSNASFKTAGAGSTGLAPGAAATRGRKVSTASTASNISVRVGGRRASNASGPPPTPRTAAKAAAQHAAAAANAGQSGPGSSVVRSGTTASARSASSRRLSAAPSSKPHISPPKKQVTPRPRGTPPKAVDLPKPQRPTEATSSKGKGKATAPQDDESVHSEPRSARSGTSTVRGRPVPFAIPGGPGHQPRKSTDTVTASTVSTIKPSVPPVPKFTQPAGTPPLRGVTLNVGIPCLITSNRAKYKAFARYIGEIHGEQGPWVGVEVPVADTWGPEKLEGRYWNDGSIRGTRYFEVGASSTPWDDSEERAARRRRLEAVLLSAGSGKKREGDTVSMDHNRLKRLRSVSPAMSDVSTMESRGLFVRPSDVIYVFDAVDDA